MSTELIIEANVSKKILFECLDLAKSFESKYSAYRDDSLLCKINAKAGIESLQCSDKEIEIFQKALDIAQKSEGLFDPTIGALTQGLYGFGKKEAKIPTQKELDKSKELVNYNNLEIIENNIFLKKSGMRLDLGGIGKGYVGDKVIDYLQDKGATKALVSVGGEICTFGKEYNIAIRDPFENRNIALIKTSKKMLSVSTSGDYERYIGSKQNHHILDSSSVKQNHYYSSISIIKDSMHLTLLDAIATIAFNSKPTELRNIAKKFDVAIIAISPDKEISLENFSNLTIKSCEFFSFN